MQCDFDTIGTLANAADVEIALVINDLMVALGFVSSATAQKEKASKEKASKEEKAAKVPKVGMPVIWSDPGEVNPAPGCREPEAADSQAEGPRRLGIGPAELLDQKRLEVAPSIHSAKAELQHRAHGRNQPSIGYAFFRMHAHESRPEAHRIIRPSSPTSSVRSSSRLT